MNKDAPFSVVSMSEKIKKALVDFFGSLGREISPINDETDLLRGTGASSDEGVDFVLDMVDLLGVEVPHDFNPFVHSSGTRGMKFSELVEHAERFVAANDGGNHGAEK